MQSLVMNTACSFDGSGNPSGVVFSRAFSLAAQVRILGTNGTFMCATHRAYIEKLPENFLVRPQNLKNGDCISEFLCRSKLWKRQFRTSR